MFKKNKRREESTFLYLENGEVKDSKSSKSLKQKIKARECDDFTDEELNSISLDLDKKEDIDDEEDEVINDMKITIFNILKFIFIFCIIAIIGFLILKISPVINEKIRDKNSSEINIESNNSSNTSQFEKDTIDNNFNNQEYEEIQNSMESMSVVNEDLKYRWDLLKNYCSNYSNGNSTIYAHKKDMSTLQYEYSQAYLNFINTEDNYKSDIDKELFDLYKKRYAILDECMSTMLETDTYNRNSIIDKLNEYVIIDNEYNEKEFDILVEKLNEYNLSYTITDTQIILNK